MKIELFFTTQILRGFKLYRRDKKRLAKAPNLAQNHGFLLARSLRWRFKLKDKICISHKKTAAVIAYSKRRVGVDIECLVERNFKAVMQFCFDEDEQNLVQNSKDQLLAFYQIWTVKEAYIKYAGLGFDQLKSVKFYEILNKMVTRFIRVDDFVIAIVYKKTKKGEIYVWRV